MNNEVICKRNEFIDIAKCLLIVLVVLAHTGFSGSKYIFWFHMPAFFLISGYLIKSDKNISDYSSWSKCKFIKMAIPYLTFLSIDFLLLYIIYKPSTSSMINYIIKSLYGGRLKSGVFWFIPCLFFSELIFKYLILRLNKQTIIFIVCLFYLVAHIESIFYIGLDYRSLPLYKNFFMNIDVCLMAIPYIAIGYYSKKYITIILNRNLYKYILFLIAIIFVIFNINGLMEYELDLKYSQYTHLILDIIIPVIFTLNIIIISKIFELYFKSKLISYIGKNSMIIMYLHLPLNMVFSLWFKYSYLMFFLIGTVIPIIFIYLIKKLNVSRFLFLGDIGSIKKVV